MKNKGDLTFNELCLLVRGLARAIELLADTDDNTAEQNAAKAIALDAQDQINEYLKPKAKFIIHKADGTEIEVSEQEWQAFVDKNCDCGGEHRKDAPLVQ